MRSMRSRVEASGARARAIGGCAAASRGEPPSEVPPSDWPPSERALSAPASTPTSRGGGVARRGGMHESCLRSRSDELRELWARDAKEVGFEGYDQGIVMAEAERSVAAILTQEVLSFEALREMGLACTQCPNLVSSRKKVVFGVGNASADLMRN